MPSASAWAITASATPMPAWSGLRAVAELAHAGLEPLGVVARLTQVPLEPRAIRAAGGHRDLRLEHAHEPELAGVGLVEVLQDLLF